jgi:hypothetical protein
MHGNIFIHNVSCSSINPDLDWLEGCWLITRLPVVPILTSWLRSVSINYQLIRTKNWLHYCWTMDGKQAPRMICWCIMVVLRRMS